MKNAYKIIPPNKIADLQKQGALLVDVRTPAEYEEKHIETAVNIPLGSLTDDQVLALCNNNKSAPIIFLCASGTRSKQASEKISGAGFENVSSVEGGTNACAAIGLKIIQGTTSVISLERQVRIAAGSFVLLGVILSYYIAPGFILLSAFVGAGLVFSGITDTCGMGMLLAKMPWNTKNCSPNSCCNK